MNKDTRLHRLHEWIEEHFGKINYSLTPVSGDASFRRYFRFKSDQHQYIAVDSPPEKESNDAFVHVTHLLAAEGLPVPHIHYSSLDFGYFLLDDLGDELLLDILNDNNVDDLYNKALHALLVIQRTAPDNLPIYDEDLLLQEMELFREWYLSKHLGKNLSQNDHDILSETYKGLANNALHQPNVFVHRDFHSRNLMNIKGKYPGIIDYQDAVNGPITYDLVSLLRDCYIEWPEDKVYNMAIQFYKNLQNTKQLIDTDEATFIKWFDLMGVQRHLKAVGIFSRLNIRDNKPNYLNDIPRTLNYITSIASKYSETNSLADLIQSKIQI